MASTFLRSLSKQHIPTILGLVILGAGLVGGIFLVNSKNTNSFLPRASAETTPKNLKVTNVADTSFTVSWVTDGSTPGYIKYGTSASNLSTTVTDDRDQSLGTVGNFTTHHVTVRSLTPSTQYFFKVGTGTQEMYDNSGSPYTATTGSSITSPAKTIYGEVVLPSGIAANGSLVYVSSDNMAPMSTIVQSSGSWVISLSQARSKDLSTAATLDTSTILSFLVVSASDTSTSLVTIPLSQSQPVPQITLGSNQDYTSTQSTTATSSASQNASASAVTQSKFSSADLSSVTQATSSAQGIVITNPATDAETITSLLPQIIGTAPSGTRITLQLKGASQQSSIQTVDTTGQFTWTPTLNLKQGAYTLTATATVQGSKLTATRLFTVDTSQAGSIPAITATDSSSLATPTPVPTITPSPTPLDTSSSSATPIASISSDLVSHPSTASGTPVTGAVENTIILLSLGLALLLFGAAGFVVLL